MIRLGLYGIDDPDMLSERAMSRLEVFLRAKGVTDGHLKKLAMSGALNDFFDTAADFNNAELRNSALGFRNLVTFKTWGLSLDYDLTHEAQLRRMYAAMQAGFRRIAITITMDKWKQEELPSAFFHQQIGKSQVECATALFKPGVRGDRMATQLSLAGWGRACSMPELITFITRHARTLQKNSHNVYITHSQYTLDENPAGPLPVMWFHWTKDWRATLEPAEIRPGEKDLMLVTNSI